MIYTLERTTNFGMWLAKIKDKKTRYRIEARLTRVITGNFGDHKQINSQLFEMRFFFGAGYRIYYTVKGSTVVLLLTGGDKSSQQQDIAMAIATLNELED